MINNIQTFIPWKVISFTSRLSPIIKIMHIEDPFRESIQTIAVEQNIDHQNDREPVTEIHKEGRSLILQTMFFFQTHMISSHFVLQSVESASSP
jgi:hypothetical protein